MRSGEAINAMNHRIDHAWTLLDELHDPEIPVLTLRDLGILRDIRMAADGVLEVIITPTYSGCPAIAQIEDDVRAILAQHQIDVRVMTQLSPAWTTDWMSESGKSKLREYGIAPPHGVRESGNVLQFIASPPAADSVSCPRCGSMHTVESSRFGSTACKAMYKCLDCKEPFDYFKPY